MKLLYKFVLCLFVAGCLFSACNESDDQIKQGLKIDQNEFTFGAEGGTGVLNVTSDTKWVARVNQPWLKVVPANGIGNVDCQILVDTTLSNDIRNAQVSFVTPQDAGQSLKVYQTGYGKMISLSESDVEVASMGEYGKRYFEIKVTSNVDYDIEIPAETEDWIQLDDEPELSFEKGAKPQTSVVRFNWEMNTDPSNRISTIAFVPKDPEVVLEKDAILNVNQLAAPLIEDNRAGDSLAVLIIREKLKATVSWDLTEKMDFWDGITLWEKTDEGVEDQMVGRVRGLDLSMMSVKEGLPMELSKLTYLETLDLYGNANRHILPDKLEMGTALAQLEHLKYLRVSAYGLTTINPSTELTRPKETLKSLNLHGNNFTSLPYSISSYNFPNLIDLDLGGMRRYDTKKDLRDDAWQTNYGMRIDASSLTNILKWDNLHYLNLAYGYIYGELPSMKGWSAKYYTADQIAANDTLNSMSAENKQRLMTEIPCVLPNLEEFRISLNFLTGEIPDWLLYHPRFLRFYPEVLIINQEDGYDRNGNVPRFTNVPDNFDYFYDFYPAYTVNN